MLLTAGLNRNDYKYGNSMIKRVLFIKTKIKVWA